MFDTHAAVEQVIAARSFCGRSNADVTTLFAGPGVFICNECVDLSTAIVAATADVTPEERARLRGPALARPTQETLGMLPVLARSIDRAEPSAPVRTRRQRFEPTQTT